MAIAIHLYYTGINGNARKFAQDMVSSGTVTQIRAEEGNLRYDYFFPMDDSETVLLIDEWENQAAIDRHHASPMMATISSLREKYDLHMKVMRYISETKDIPIQDEQYIRK